MAQARSPLCIHSANGLFNQRVKLVTYNRDFASQRQLASPSRDLAHLEELREFVFRGRERREVCHLSQCTF